MKVLAKWMVVAALMMVIPEMKAFAETSLQSRINALPMGGTLKLEKGIYHEAIVMNKPMTLVGTKGAIFQTCGSDPAITITGKNVTLKGVKLKQCAASKAKAVISISGDQHHLEDLTISTGNTGIKLTNTVNSNLESIKITGQGKENAIDLWQSPHNTFENISIRHVQDGFYMENSDKNSFLHNTIQDSRYGMHIMFSDQITLKGNTSTRNITGAMVMGTQQTLIEKNNLIANNQNVNAQGLLLYDVHHSVIQNNLLSQNRIGMYIEDSSGNQIHDNEVNANFIGAQIRQITKNTIKGNSFIGNVNEIQATDSSDNKLENNYWDAALKLDIDGDGKSNLPYRADPYFLNLTRETPPYQLLFQHPGLTLLQKMLKSPEPLLVTDSAPLMNNRLLEKHPERESNTAQWGISLIMISISLLMIYLGRRKQ
ncbi:right-handed parallel beta-helix repeat-containing protein [Bacillus sp. JJ1764]|uniref:right-handed parallel beta-helix repeat-containing protein n=1 Tax=Bacillus sp. JJ1764 TaxID=3122964 RepID=UPI0030005E96